MKKTRKGTGVLIVLLLMTMVIGTSFLGPISTEAQQIIKIFINGREIHTDVDPVIISDRTMVPVRFVTEELGMEVDWDGVNRHVLITNPVLDDNEYSGSVTIPADGKLSIMGDSMLSAQVLQDLMLANNPSAPSELPALYLQIGQDYGIRGDVAFCQAAKETGWWKYGGLVKAYQNNYCGLSATGKAATGNEDLRGSDPTRVWFTEGVHGAIFKTPADGVEAHVQHLYAYVSKSPLPAGKILLDPRFVLVTRGIAQTWSDLDGRWAVPGVGYGQSILNDYYAQAINNSDSDNMVSMTPEEKIAQLEKDKQLLQLEVLRLQRLLDEK